MNKIAVFLFLLIAATACGTEPSNNSLASGDVYGNTYSEDYNESGFIESIALFPVEELSQEESEGLLFMREEEKLARDVYLTMYEKYSLRIFNNISQSELTHMNALKLLIDKYELEDPVGENGVGTFNNSDLQELYNELITAGNISEIEALKVGSAIEEIDIIDLQKEIDDSADNTDLEFVYNNLKMGSENHLRAFVRNLSVRGITYTPQYLDEATFNSIIN